MWSLGERSNPLPWLILRGAVGVTFVVHGVPKLMAPNNFVDFFGSLGIPMPLVAVVVVGLVEVLGGAALVIGKGVRVAAGLLAADMVGAILLAKRFMGFLGGWELDFLLLAACLSLMLATPGGGRYSRR